MSLINQPKPGAGASPVRTSRFALVCLAVVLLVAGLPQVKMHHHAQDGPHQTPGVMVLLDHVEDHRIPGDYGHGDSHTDLHVHEATTPAFFSTTGRSDLVIQFLPATWILPVDARPAGTVDPLPLQRPPIV